VFGDSPYQLKTVISSDQTPNEKSTALLTSIAYLL